MERLTGYDENGRVFPREEERLLSASGAISKDDMYKIMMHLAEKLAGYEDLEEQGKLLKLPCANWMEIVFGNQEVFWGIDMDYMENPIREISVDNSERMTWYDGWRTVVLKGADENGLDWEFSPEEIGKTVFLTKSDAEQVLEDLEGESV